MYQCNNMTRGIGVIYKIMISVSSHNNKMSSKNKSIANPKITF